MDTLEYNNLLSKSVEYFASGKYQMFLDVFAKCYNIDTTCFEDDVNVFRFSFASYAVGGEGKLNEFNRFCLHLGKYLNSLNLSSNKLAFLKEIKNTINQNFDKFLHMDSVVTYQQFNNCTVCLTQQYKLLEWVFESGILEEKGFIEEEVHDIKNMLNVLRKISRFTASRFVVHFAFLPSKPKKYFNEIEEKLGKFIVV